MAVKSMGPSYNTLQILDIIGSICLTPYDWNGTPGQYWKTKYKDGAQDIVQKSLPKRGAKQTMGMLTV